MKKVLILALTGVISTAAAQQKVAATYSPITIDGVTTPNGMVTIGGKTYVLTTALTAGGAALLKTNSLGLYRYPNAQKQPLVLKGCQGEWLFNGVDKLRVDSATWDANRRAYNIRITVQTPLYNREWYLHFSTKETSAVYQSGKVLQPSKNPIQQINYVQDGGGSPETGRNNIASIWVTDPDDTGSDTLTKIVIPTGSTEFGSNVMSVDLTCKK